MNRLLLTLFLFTTTLVLSAQETKIKGKVIAVNDGDTFIIQINPIYKEKIRITSIDTFETGNSKKTTCQAKVFNTTKEEIILKGNEAKNYAKKLFEDKNKEYIFILDEDKNGLLDRDRMDGRLLGNIVLEDGSNYADLLITKKLAYLYMGKELYEKCGMKKN